MAHLPIPLVLGQLAPATSHLRSLMQLEGPAAVARRVAGVNTTQGTTIKPILFWDTLENMIGSSVSGNWLEQLLNPRPLAAAMGKWAALNDDGKMLL